MSRFLHVADLHLNPEEYEYSAAVVANIQDVATESAADAVVVAGHLADVPEPFAELIGGKTPWFWVRGASDPMHIGGAQRLEPLAVTSVADVEILALPSGAGLAEFDRWKQPSKTSRWRLAVAHAPTLTLASPIHDADAVVLDPAWLERWEIDYLALGCAHETRSPSRVGGMMMADPGAARVTPGGETGPRGGFLVDLDQELRMRWLHFSAAGCRRDITVPVAPDGSFDVDTTCWRADDSVCLRLCGSLHPAIPGAVEQEALRRFSPIVRQLTIDSRELVRVKAGAAELAKQLGRATQHRRAAPLSRSLLAKAG